MNGPEGKEPETPVRKRRSVHEGMVAVMRVARLGEMGAFLDAETGNLEYRYDSLNSASEHFSYDALGRLTTLSFYGSGPALSRHYTYEDNGNLTYITSTGTISYDDPDCPYKATSLTNPAYVTTPIPRQDIYYNAYE